MATGSKDGAWAGAAHRRGALRWVLVGGLVIAAAVAVLLALGRTADSPRAPAADAGPPITTSPPAAHPVVTEPTRPTPLPPR